MTLPRFSSGQVGALTFDTLNQVFEFVDQERGKRDSAFGTNLKPNQVLVSRILARHPTLTTRYKWEEVAWNGLTYQPNAVRSSTWAGNEYKYPVVSEVALDTGSIQSIHAHAAEGNQTDLGLVYVPMRSTPASPVFSAKITGATLIASNPLRWKYSWQEVKRSDISDTWVVQARSGPDAFNGCEWTGQDGPLVFGVGLTLQSAGFASLVRQSIRTEVIVMMTESPSGKFWFSVPNQFKATCQ